MSLKSYQRSYLMKMAQKVKPVVYVGKSGVAAAVAKSLDEALEHHELVKIRFIDFKPEKKELSAGLAAETDSDVVQVIGNVAVLFRQHPDPDQRTILLPKRR